MMTRFYVWIVLAAIVTVIGVSPVFSEEQQAAAVVASEPYSDLSTKDTIEAIDIVSTYIQSHGPSREQLSLFDLTAGQYVELTLNKILTDQTLKVSTNIIGVCATFLSPEEQNYTVWFVVQKGITSKQIISGSSREVHSPNKMMVKDVVIHEVDGHKQVEWVKNDQGVWEARHLKAAAESPPETDDVNIDKQDLAE